MDNPETGNIGHNTRNKYKQNKTPTVLLIVNVE